MTHWSSPGAPSVPSATSQLILCDDFIMVAVTSSGWNSVISGTVAANTVALGEAGHPGIINSSTGTDSTGRAGMFTGVAAILLGSGATVWEAIVRFPNLSTSSDEYIARIGLSDGTAGDAVDGVYFEYDRATNGDFWVIKTASNSSRTTTVTTTAVAGTTWYHLKCEINAAATSATYYINGVSVGTISSNFPTTSGRVTGASWNIIKSAGTTARTMDCDAFSLSMQLSTPR